MKACRPSLVEISSRIRSIARIHVVEVDAVTPWGWSRQSWPTVCASSRKHAPHPLEVLQGGGLLHQGVDQLRMERIALAQIVGAVIALAHRRQRLAVRLPDLLVGLHDLLQLRLRSIELEQAPGRAPGQFRLRWWV